MDIICLKTYSLCTTRYVFTWGLCGCTLYVFTCICPQNPDWKRTDLQCAFYFHFPFLPAFSSIEELYRRHWKKKPDFGLTALWFWMAQRHKNRMLYKTTKQNVLTKISQLDNNSTTQFNRSSAKKYLAKCSSSHWLKQYEVLLLLHLFKIRCENT